ncbi:hypothetical protein [Nonomuraea sp. NEAU-A123]|uniref:hypothetical protein n=1 Tax=Nonomuraea sp. NEAU-A123 TaxID=2839649 RepID=UPI001BE4451D|nr:hypothetical protein [Nonomuraea sp. NEAU-A123]MBT2225998.1 hypothetical protein [Nonomuraea sp. NEAU-A123]
MTRNMPSSRASQIVAPRIKWERSPVFHDIEYGMVGRIRAFSIAARVRFILYPRLPGKNGLVGETKEFPSVEKAKERADELLAEFLKDFGIKAPDRMDGDGSYE